MIYSCYNYRVYGRAQAKENSLVLSVISNLTKRGFFRKNTNNIFDFWTIFNLPKILFHCHIDNISPKINSLTIYLEKGFDQYVKNLQQYFFFIFFIRNLYWLLKEC